MLLPAFDALKIQHDATHQFVRFQWLDPHNRVLRPALNHGRHVIEMHCPHLSLVDFTSLPPISLVDELWLSTHWFPRIVQSSLRQVAIVVRPEHLHNQMAMEAMFWVARALMRFQVQIFDEIPPALEWLLADNTAAALALQNEWNAAPVTLTLPTGT